jgi:ubiquinone/menaquinone biosynthesis C-methylase UbiE
LDKRHLEYLGSPAWTRELRDELFPWALDGVDLGAHLLEIGPGPGLTTDQLLERVPRVTAVDVDEALAAALRDRLRETGAATVVTASGADLPFSDGVFSSAVSFSMLHHVPSVPEQDALFGETCRVLHRGGVFVGWDSVDSPQIREAHADDVYNPIDPGEFAPRLRAAGFASVHTEARGRWLRFLATAPS